MKKTIVLLLCLLPIMLSNSQAQPETDAPASQYNIKYVLKKDGKIVETKAWDMSTGELKYPKEIPFIEYSLESTSCEWIDLRHYKDTVIVINSDEELENYLVCTDGSYQEIDFSKYTLLLTNGIA
ncbi:MAG: hypothetical protein LBR45_03375, partial [Bacteroidales bacterium]|nr:hypothetical protein [Bacteroidales bacterium]